MQNVLNKLCLEVGANFNPEDFDAGTTFIPNLEKYFTVRKKEAAIETLKRDVILKRRMSMSDVNGPPGVSEVSSVPRMLVGRRWWSPSRQLCQPRRPLLLLLPLQLLLLLLLRCPCELCFNCFVWLRATFQVRCNHCDLL
jgi:hypothetical protein